MLEDLARVLTEHDRRPEVAVVEGDAAEAAADVGCSSGEADAVYVVGVAGLEDEMEDVVGEVVESCVWFCRNGETGRFNVSRWLLSNVSTRA